MKKLYEYMTLELRHHPGLQPPILMEDQLNEQGREGWELVAVLEKQWPPKALLKRELELNIFGGPMEADRTLEDPDVQGPPP